MDNNKKFKYLGYADLINSLMQIGAVAGTTGYYIYCILNNKKYPGFSPTYFWPVVNSILTVVLVGINLVQIKSARKLIRAGNADVGRQQMEDAIDKWKLSNLVTSLAAFFLLPGIWTITFRKHEWNNLVILGLYMGILTCRGMITIGIYMIKFAEEVEMTYYPVDLIGGFMNIVQRFRVQHPEAPMRDPEWI